MAKKPSIFHSNKEQPKAGREIVFRVRSRGRLGKWKTGFWRKVKFTTGYQSPYEWICYGDRNFQKSEIQVWCYAMDLTKLAAPQKRKKK